MGYRRGLATAGDGEALGVVVAAPQTYSVYRGALGGGACLRFGESDGAFAGVARERPGRTESDAAERCGPGRRGCSV